MSDTPKPKSNKAAIAIIAATSAAAGYLAHDPLRAELKTAAIYGDAGPLYVPPPPPQVARQVAATEVAYSGEHGAPVSPRKRK